MSEIHSETLKEIVDRLVRGMEPDSIYLFGSQARGQTDPGSDIDLLLVLPDSDLPRHKREAEFQAVCDRTDESRVSARLSGENLHYRPG